MKKINRLFNTTLVVFFISLNFLYSQSIIDECLSSITVVTSSDFNSSNDVANISSADVIEWDGNNWLGGFPNANMTIAPLTNQIGCRAIFLGNGTSWTSGGEAIGLKLNSPLVSGSTYSFDITYVSHGLGSNGSFSPIFYTNSLPNQIGATQVGNLTPVGFNWETNNLTFVASPSQNGDEWIILRTETNSSSGLISSFCQNCTLAVPTCSVTVNDEMECEGSTVTITASTNSSGTFSYQWTVPAGAIDPGNVSSFTTDISGTYAVTATDTANNCIANGSGNVIFNPTPNVSVNNATICENNSTTIIASLAIAGNYSYQWTVPSGVQNPGNVPSFNSSIAGDYTVVVTNTDTNCNASATGTISISSRPVFTVNSETICEGTSTFITASSSTSGNYEYIWTVPVGFLNPGNVDTFSTDVAGIYSVIVNDLDTNCSSDSVSASLNFLPDFDFTIDQFCFQEDLILEVLPVNNSFDLETSSFSWELNNSNVIGNDSEINLSSYLNFTSIVESFPLNLSITVTSVNGCSNIRTITIDQILCSIPEGISPNNDGINDSLDLSLLNVKKLQIFNRYGRLVYHQQNYLNEWHGQTDSGDILPSGTYFYVIEFGNGSDAKSSWIYLNK